MEERMLDLAYLLIALVFFLAIWGFVLACDHL